MMSDAVGTPATGGSSATRARPTAARSVGTTRATLIVNVVLLMVAFALAAHFGLPWARSLPAAGWAIGSRSHEGLASFPPSIAGLRPALAELAVRNLLLTLLGLAALQLLMLALYRRNGAPSFGFMLVSQLLIMAAGLCHTEWGAEILIGPHRGYYHMYPHAVRHWDYNPYSDHWAYDTDRHGLRGLEAPAEKAPNEFRILVLGDSISAGSDLALKYTYPWVMEAQLRKLYPDRLIRVKNGACVGYSIQQNTAVLEEIYDQYRPDLIVGEFTHANAEIVQMYETGLMKNGLFRWLRGQIFRSDMYLWLRRELNNASSPRQDAGAPPGIVHRNDPRIMTAGLDALTRFCTDHGVKLVFYIPLITDLPDDHNTILEYAAADNYPYIDLRAKWRRVPNIEDLLQDTHHPNVPGCVMQANDILQGLIDLKLLPAPLPTLPAASPTPR